MESYERMIERLLRHLNYFKLLNIEFKAMLDGWSMQPILDYNLLHLYLHPELNNRFFDELAIKFLFEKKDFVLYLIEPYIREMISLFRREQIRLLNISKTELTKYSFYLNKLENILEGIKNNSKNWIDLFKFLKEKDSKSFSSKILGGFEFDPKETFDNIIKQINNGKINTEYAFQKTVEDLTTQISNGIVQTESTSKKMLEKLIYILDLVRPKRQENNLIDAEAVQIAFILSNLNRKNKKWFTVLTASKALFNTCTQKDFRFRPEDSGFEFNLAIDLTYFKIRECILSECKQNPQEALKKAQGFLIQLKEIKKLVDDTNAFEIHAIGFRRKAISFFLERSEIKNQLADASRELNRIIEEVRNLSDKWEYDGINLSYENHMLRILSYLDKELQWIKEPYNLKNILIILSVKLNDFQNLIQDLIDKQKKHNKTKEYKEIDKEL